jgi:hypothetical protein
MRPNGLSLAPLHINIRPTGGLKVRRITSKITSMMLTAAALLSGGGLVSAASDTACSETSRAARKACDAGATDDFWIAKATCANVAAGETRRQCLVDAQDARAEAQQECTDQFHARRDLCDALGQAPYDPPIDPTQFLSPQATAASPNPYFPLVPGTTKIFRGDGEIVTVTVTNQTKTIQGVTTMIVQDDVVDECTGRLIETTQDFFAQQVDGTVWYFGEITQSVSENGLVSTEGSFLAGVDGAKAGIIMKGNPQIGDVYRQEFFLGDAEDVAEVTSTTGSESTPGASCSGNCVVTRDFTPLEPGGDEQKFYAPGVGEILTIDPTGERSELQ